MIMSDSKMRPVMGETVRAASKKLDELALTRGQEWSDAVYLLMNIKLILAIIKEPAPKTALVTSVAAWTNMFINRTAGPNATDEEKRKLSRALMGDIDSVVEIPLGRINELLDEHVEVSEAGLNATKRA